ncbi:DUF2218 domain-containing protein [Brucellaceae bacterium C25G]
MAISTAHVLTQNASRYLQQLCKHWSHKFDVEFTPNDGRIVFTDGRIVTLKATDSALEIAAEAPSETQAELEEVVANHIIRFAFREELIFDWSRPA